MKTFILVLVLILVVFFIFKVSSNKDKQLTSPLEEVNYINESPLVDGVYSVASSTSVAWSGDKPLIAGYVDSGVLNIKEGSLDISGENMTGRFVFDMQSITAETTGAGGGAERLTTHLKSADFFEVEKYPLATLEISEVIKTEGDDYIVKGTLEMKDAKNPIEFPARIFGENEGVRVVANVVVDRTLWNVKFGSGKFFDNLADKVINDIFNVKVDMLLVK
jgi:polyisoprenoid-binding protein YceI